MIVNTIKDDILGDLILQGEDDSNLMWAKKEIIQGKEIWVYFDIDYFAYMEEEASEKEREDSLSLRKSLKHNYQNYLFEKDNLYKSIVDYYNSLEFEKSVTEKDITISEIRLLGYSWSVIFEIKQCERMLALEYYKKDDDDYEKEIYYECEVEIVSNVEI